MEPFIGQLMPVGFNFAPRGWALCNGQLLSINQNSALFSLLGTMYGGDGRSTFALPDLRGRVPIHQGRGSGLTPRTMGQRGGAERIIITPAGRPRRAGNVMPSNNPRASALEGSNMQPYLTINWVIALAGVFPSRS